MELNGITHFFNLEFVLDGPFLKPSPTVQLRHRKTWGESNWPHVGVGSVHGCLVGLRRTSLWTQVASQLLRGWLSKLCGSLEVMCWANFVSVVFSVFLYFFSYFYISCMFLFLLILSKRKGKRCCIASTNENFLDFAAWLLIATVPQFAGLRCPPWVNGSPCAPCHENLFDHLENTSLTGDIFSIGFIPSTYHCDPAIAYLDTRNCCKGNYLWIQ